MAVTVVVATSWGERLNIARLEKPLGPQGALSERLETLFEHNTDNETSIERQANAQTPSIQRRGSATGDNSSELSCSKEDLFLKHAQKLRRGLPAPH